MRGATVPAIPGSPGTFTIVPWIRKRAKPIASVSPTCAPSESMSEGSTKA